MKKITLFFLIGMLLLANVAVFAKKKQAKSIDPINAKQLVDLPKKTKTYQDPGQYSSLNFYTINSNLIRIGLEKKKK